MDEVEVDETDEGVDEKMADDNDVADNEIMDEAEGHRTMGDHDDEVDDFLLHDEITVGILDEVDETDTRQI